MTNIKEAIRRLNVLAIETVSQYNQELARGGAPAFPSWTQDLIDLIESHQHAVQTATAVRDMLRDDFHMADNRDAAVAESVRAWYLRQYPHLGVMPDQPDLANIIEGVRAVPAEKYSQADTRWSDDELAMLSEFSKNNPRPPLRFNRIVEAMHREESPTLQAYLADQLKGGKQ